MRKISIGNSSTAYTDHVVLDNGVLVYASIVDYDSTIKKMVKNLNDNNNIWISGYGNGRAERKAYVTQKEKDSDTGLTHLVITKKDVPIKEGVSTFTGYIYYKTEEELKQLLFKKLNKNLSVPLIEEWTDYIYEQLNDNNLLVTMRTMYESDLPFHVKKVFVNDRYLSGLISRGLQQHIINVNGRNTVSPTMDGMAGINEYLNTFGEILAYKIQETFVPKFIPGEHEYSETVNNFEDYCWDEGKGIQIFEAQKATIQSMVNHFNVKKQGFIISEMGTGKTLMGCGVTYAHGKQTGNNNIVMCPSHLVHKWKREIERFVPNSEAIIVENVADLIDLEPKLKNKARVSNVYLVMSKESAKFDYELRPAVRWSTSHNCFVCPECGKPLFKEVWIGEGSAREKIQVRLTDMDFLKKNAYNQVCENDVEVWNSKTKAMETKKCHSVTWTPLIKEFYEDSEWVKLGTEGWVLTEHIQKLITELQGQEETTNKERKLLSRLIKYNANITEGVITKRAPRKYSLSKYVKNRWNGLIDYVIFDELHQLKGDSKQGQAMADLTSACKYTLGLTGTLLNGYASGIFYILYRIFPSLMRKEGYEYSDENEFMRNYGVVRRTSRHIRSRYGEESQASSKEKALPGISPIVFTKFLLDNAAFLSLSDMAEGLPEYTEHPVGVDMDTELRQRYRDVEEILRNGIHFRSGGSKILSQLMQCLSAYPDSPHCQPPIINLDTNEVIATPYEMADELRNKELAIIELAEQKIQAGEKVLIYYHLTNKTDIAQKIKIELENRGINAKIMDSKVKATEREVWIDKQLENGLEVLLCNPTLVETGLDLLQFTTIIFSQFGTNIFTMRQASRRSWRLGQTQPIDVYFMYYNGTVQEQSLALMATKLQASMAIEGKFSEEGLRAMSNNEDLLTQIANSVVNGIKETVDVNAFNAVTKADATTMEQHVEITRPRRSRKQILVKEPKVYTAHEQLLIEMLRSSVNTTNFGLRFAI